MSNKNRNVKKDVQEKQLQISVKVSGGLQARFEFQYEEEVLSWLKNGFQELQKKYGNLNIYVEGLPPLKVGQECYVFGEGRDIFKITGTHKFSDNSYAYILDGSEYKSVSSCFVLNEKDEYVKYSVNKRILNKTAIMKIGIMNCEVE